MKFRDIAKLHAFNVGLKTPMTAADLDYYNGVLGDTDSATPGRVDKANAALDALSGQLAKKWGLSKKFVNAAVPNHDGIGDGAGD